MSWAVYWTGFLQIGLVVVTVAAVLCGIWYVFVRVLDGLDS
jgi:hypothetical protein